MKLSGGIDLHSNNSVLALLDEDERLVYRKRLGNDAPSILEALAPYREGIASNSKFELGGGSGDYSDLKKPIPRGRVDRKPVRQPLN